jgi:REase_MTES_1575/AAA domain
MSHQSDEVLVRDRSRRLFTFLKELSQLRSTSVRSWKGYPNVIWLGSLPPSLKHKSLISSDPDAEINPLDPIAQIPESEFLTSSEASTTPDTQVDSEIENDLDPEVVTAQAAVSTAEDRVSTDPILADLISAADPPAQETFSADPAYLEATAGDVWLEVLKPDLPSPPAISKLLRPWITDKELRDSSAESPRLKATLEENFQTSEGGEDNSQQQPPPEVQKAWDKYVQEHWKAWARRDKHLRTIQDVYEKLYSIYQLQQTSSERYELVIGVGLLNWKPQGQSPMQRHILTSRASLSFDAARGALIVGPPAEGSKIILEQDMLDAGDLPKQKETSRVSELLQEEPVDIWQREKLERMIKSWVHAVSARGRYEPDVLPSETVTSDPVVFYAPALILRERSEHSLIQVFEKIADQIEHGTEVPLSIRRLVAIADDSANQNETVDEEAVAGQTSEVYFPLLSNPAQRQIAERLRARQGVLVQGPPGTGKSQTIANLVCHLLAEGQRVLVTSHTPRALSVLRDKFPEELRSLCVTLTGEDSNEILKNLEDSVRGITAKQHDWNSEQNARLQEYLSKTLSGTQQRRSEIIQELCQLRQSDTTNHESKFGAYNGTTEQIAVRIKAEEKAHGWITDDIQEETEAPLTNDECAELLRLATELTLSHAREASYLLIDPKLLPDPGRFSDLVRGEAQLRIQYEATETDPAMAGFDALMALTEPERALLFQGVARCLDKLNTLHALKLRWLDAAVRDALINRDKPWRDLAAITAKHIKALESAAEKISEMEITGLEGMNIQKVLADAENLQDHLALGGKLGIGPFRAKAVKNGLYLTEQVFVNGRRCDNPEVLEDLLCWLEAEERLQNLYKHWQGVKNELGGSFIKQLNKFHVLHDELVQALSMQDAMLKLQEQLPAVSLLLKISFSEENGLPKLLRAIEAAAKKAALRFYEGTFESLVGLMKQAVAEPKAHPLHQHLFTAVQNRSVEEYRIIHEHLLVLQDARMRLNRRAYLFKLLDTVAPKTSLDFAEQYLAPVWVERFKNFEAAWAWARCRSWMREASNTEHELQLVGLLDECDKNIRSLLGELAIAKAWGACFGRLTEKERQYLVAWTKAVKRIGKGTGKYASRHRQAARDNMQHCKSAIPAWIMPIHRVAETIEPGQDAFDVVIIDEASQSGPEALFLQYLAKKIVIVGDDKQISPDFVGLSRENVESLRARYVYDIPNSDALGLDNSFFDLSEIRYGGRIRLREHFRCMPEIIHFSNTLCYASEPLVPLRQYGAERLVPLVSTFVEEGFVTADAKQLNVPEAEMLIQQIKDCVKDPSYVNKTFGVISLLNTSQQAKYIEQRLLDELGQEEIENRKLRVGDPYDFQGDERDVIFLSMVSAKSEDKRIGALTKDKDERRFNVAASRARDQMWLFHSVTPEDLSPKCLRSKLLVYFQNPPLEGTADDLINLQEMKDKLTKWTSGASNDGPPQPFESWLEVSVFVELRNRGFAVFPKIELNNYCLDLVVEGRSVRFGIECESDQWTGLDQYRSDLERQRELERCGMRVWRIRGSAYYLNPEEALKPLLKQLDLAGIRPKDVPQVVAPKTEVPFPIMPTQLQPSA